MHTKVLARLAKGVNKDEPTLDDVLKTLQALPKQKRTYRIPITCAHICTRGQWLKDLQSYLSDLTMNEQLLVRNEDMILTPFCPYGFAHKAIKDLQEA